MTLIDGTTYRNPQSGARCRLLRIYTDSTWIPRITKHSRYMETAEMVEYLNDYEEGVGAQ